MKWLRSYRLEVVIDSLSLYGCMLIALHETKTCYRLGIVHLVGPLLLEKYYWKNIIGKDFNKFDYLMFLARFSL